MRGWKIQRDRRLDVQCVFSGVHFHDGRNSVQQLRGGQVCGERGRNGVRGLRGGLDIGCRRGGVQQLRGGQVCGERGRNGVHGLRRRGVQCLWRFCLQPLRRGKVLCGRERDVGGRVYTMQQRQVLLERRDLLHAV